MAGSEAERQCGFVHGKNRSGSELSGICAAAFGPSQRPGACWELPECALEERPEPPSTLLGAVLTRVDR